MKRQILLVDGYNMIGAWPELTLLKNQEKLADARDLLLFQLSNYSKYEGLDVIVVFDAQLVPGIQQEYRKFQLTVIFTKTGETADSYIEKRSGELMSRVNQVTVATSDLAEQWLVFSKGALRKSANELYQDTLLTRKKIEQDARTFRFANAHRNSAWSQTQLSGLQQLLEDLSDD